MSRADVADPDRRLPAARADALWEAAYARADDPFLALRAAEALPFGAYKVVDYLSAHSATVGDACRRLAEFFRIVDVRAVLEIEHHPPALVMRTASGEELPPAAQEYSFAAVVQRLSRCTEPGWAPEAIELTFAAPPNTEVHARVLIAPLRFSAPRARIVFSQDSWDAPITGSEPALVSVLEDHAARLLAELPPSDELPGQVRAAIAAGLAEGEATAPRVAKRLATSERTLQRRLKERGLTFAGLLDEARFALARAHLRDPQVALAEIAWLLGFSDQSAFTRAFRRWAGETPGAWRAALG